MPVAARRAVDASTNRVTAGLVDTGVGHVVGEWLLVDPFDEVGAEPGHHPRDGCGVADIEAVFPGVLGVHLHPDREAGTGDLPDALELDGAQEPGPALQGAPHSSVRWFFAGDRNAPIRSQLVASNSTPSAPAC